MHEAEYYQRSICSASKTDRERKKDCNDGYFYRDEGGVTNGPFERFDFDQRQLDGLIKPGMKAWRRKGASYFQVRIDRQITIGRAFSLVSCGYCAEICAIAFSLAALFVIVRTPAMQKELREGFLLGGLIVVTLGMTLFSLRMNCHRLAVAASEVITVEPLV